MPSGTGAGPQPCPQPASLPAACLPAHPLRRLCPSTPFPGAAGTQSPGTPRGSPCLLKVLSARPPEPRVGTQVPDDLQVKLSPPGTRCSDAAKLLRLLHWKRDAEPGRHVTRSGQASSSPSQAGAVALTSSRQPLPSLPLPGQPEILAKELLRRGKQGSGGRREGPLSYKCVGAARRRRQAVYTDARGDLCFYLFPRTRVKVFRSVSSLNKF